MTANPNNTSTDKAGWSVAEWAPAAGISRAMHYKLNDEQRPRFVRVGDLRVIVESPSDWLQRVAAAGGVFYESKDKE